MGRKNGEQRRAARRERERIRKIKEEQERLLREAGLDNNNTNVINEQFENFRQFRSEQKAINENINDPVWVNANQELIEKHEKIFDESPEKGKVSSTGNTGTLLQNKQAPIRTRGGLLRYPLEAMTDSTDYLQIDIVEYSPIGQQNEERSGSATLVSLPGNRRNTINRNKLPKGVSTKSLVNKGTVLLQIPANIQDGNSINAGDSKMNSIVGAALGAGTDLMTDVGTALGTKAPEGSNRLAEAGKAATNAIQGAIGDSGANTKDIRNLITKKLAASAVNALGGNVTMNQLLARQDGTIFNPNMELLFNGPTLRNFRFSFKMTPRGKDEAEQIKLIMRTFKMNMAPKVTSGGPNLFLKTPNVFELRYKSGRRDHPFLHKFKQCFLTDISVNYTAEGVYATYENKEPISMIMDLTFKELEPIYDIDYFDKYGYDADNTVGY